ncbi:GNAT family N-acetyltransferase [Streptomyces sp. MBT65]|uniref:GNAT family N-acetyltransferase n=1 Tax=Streptomyces sp. MBT65 TaxID=1488395 RepID=UPI00190C575B|nr:GNAT family N-acetyltransferase [Streptomyces sp. MBT65]MBK3573913.1 GNAT family N-acetyltransferase [Streptomyces sp. MBT65]
MTTSLDVPPLPEPAPGADWTLRPLADAGHGVRAYAAVPRDGGTPVELRLHRVQHHPVRACYPYGAHDIAVGLVLVEDAETMAVRLLSDLVPALFAADPHCRRVVAAPAEDDTATQSAFEAGGFRRVAEADLPNGSVVLFTAEPAWIADVPTALDDMPH